MSEEIQLTPVDERGIKLLDELEAKTALLPFKTDAQGGRTYALSRLPRTNSTGCSTASAATAQSPPNATGAAGSGAAHRGRQTAARSGPMATGLLARAVPDALV